MFVAQSVSVLAFIHDRDPALVARLTDELTRGATVERARVEHVGAAQCRVARCRVEAVVEEERTPTLT